MKQMTHNEYHEYKKELAKKIYDPNIEYNVKDFLNDSKEVNVIDFDLEQYDIPDRIKQIINKEMGTNKQFDHYEIFYGHVDLDDSYFMAKKLDCGYGLPFGYAGYYRNNDYMMIINYAESDFDISLYNDKELYNQAVIQTHNFYEKQNFYFLDDNVWTESEIYNIGEEDNPDIKLIYEAEEQEEIEEDGEELE